MARWSPLALPDTRRAMSAAYRRAAKAIALTSQHPANTTLRDKAAEQTIMIRAQADAIDDSELTWVSRDMTAVAVGAAHSLPMWTPAAARPTMYGLLIWEGALPDLRTDDGVTSTSAVPIDGMRWAPHSDAAIAIDLLTRTEPVEVGVADRAGAGYFGGAGLYATKTIVMPLYEPAAAYAAQQFLGKQPDWVQPVLRIIGATWIVSQQPTIAERSQEWRDPDPNRAGKPPRPTPDVTIVDLRRRKVPSDSEPGGSGRTYSHRWVVGGHWRTYHTGPGRTVAEPRYITDYVAGPDDKPLILTEKVKVWRR